MTRDEVLKEFTEGLIIWEREGERQRRMADEIVRLRDMLAAVEAERETEIKKLHELWSHEITARVSSERILDALREPSEAVWRAAWEAYDTDESLADAIRAAATAAEKEVSS